MGVVITIWHIPAHAPATTCRCTGKEPSLFRIMRKIN